MNPTSPRRASVRSRSDKPTILRPDSATDPASGVSKSPAMCNSVDLPAPEGATKATTSPRFTSSVAPRSTATSPAVPRL